MGFSGNSASLIDEKDGKFSIVTDPSLDPSLTYLIKRILRIGAYYIRLERCVSRMSQYEKGMVSHAFAFGLRTILNEYLHLLSELEDRHRNGTLTIQKLWYLLQPSRNTLHVLDSFVKKAEMYFGGALLNMIYLEINATGDEKNRMLLELLLKKAAVPFFEIMEQWLTNGIINDPYHEFFVEEDRMFSKDNLNQDYNDAYWERRYTLKEDKVPTFLSDLSNKVLVTGKYLNVLLDSGIELKTQQSPLIYQRDPQVYVAHIERAFSFASKKLLDYLREDHQLERHLSSLKHYFLLDHGDFFVHFLDIANTELRKHVLDIVPAKLNSLLELSLRTSVAVTDIFKDRLTCQLMPYNLLHQLIEIIHVAEGHVQLTSFPQRPKVTDTTKLSGLEAFTLDYQVEWPLSLIISRKALTKYQLIFRHLFLCKYVEKQLNQAWQRYKATKILNLKGTLGASFGLCHRMLSFLHNLEYYMCFEVLEPNSFALKEKIQNAQTIDEILHGHNEHFLDTCLKECLLTDRNLVSLITRLMSVCVMFANLTEGFMKELDDGDKRLNKVAIDVISQHAQRLIREEGFAKTLARFDSKFSSTLIQFIGALHQLSTQEANHHTANLALQLDFNGYYSARIFPISDSQLQTMK